MAISDLAQREPGAAKKGPDCSVCLALDSLSEADAAGLRAMLADPRRRFTEIAALIGTDEDTPEWIRGIRHDTYRRHAKGDCAARERLR